MAAAQYRVILTDVLNRNPIGEFSQITSLTYTDQLSAAGSASLVVPLVNTGGALTITPGASAIWVMRNEVLTWGGIVWTVSPDFVGQTLTINATGPLDYFNHRTVRQAYSASKNMSGIIVDLINLAQSTTYGNIGLDVSKVGTTLGTFTSVAFTLSQRQNIGQYILSSAQNGGHDFYTTPTVKTRGSNNKVQFGWTLNYQTLGGTPTSSGYTFRLQSKTIRALEMSIDATAVANVIDVIPSGAQQETDITKTGTVATGGNPTPFPQLDWAGPSTPVGGQATTAPVNQMQIDTDPADFLLWGVGLSVNILGSYSSVSVTGNNFTVTSRQVTVAPAQEKVTATLATASASFDGLVFKPL